MASKTKSIWELRAIRESDRADAAERLLREAKDDLDCALQALTKIKQWPMLNPPQYRTAVPANEFLYLRDLVSAGLFGAVK